MSEKTKKVCVILTFVLSIISVILTCLLIGEKDVAIYVPILLIIATFVLCISSVMSIRNRKDSLFKISIISIFFLCIGIGIYVVLLKTNVLNLLKEAENISDLIAKSGIWGPIVYIVIQFAQVTFVPIPSTVTIAAGVVAFNNVGLVIVYSTIGLITGSLFAFFLGRTFGVKLVVWIVGSKSFNKYQKILRGRDKTLLFMMFLLPVFPDDLLCLFAGITTMSYSTFILMQIVARPIGVAMSSLSVELIKAIPFQGWYILLWVAIGLALVVMMVCVWKYSGKLEDAMVRFVVKYFGTNELHSTIDTTQLRVETQDLISTTIVETDSDLDSIISHNTQRYKARKYYISYSD